MNAQTSHVDFDYPKAPSLDDSFGIADLIATLPDSELAALEDELDFFAFTGVPSQRMLRIIEKAGQMDDAWRSYMDRDYRTVVPTVIKFKPMATHRRAQSRRLPLQALPALPETA